MDGKAVSWFILQVLNEKRAVAALEEVQIPTFLPTVSKWAITRQGRVLQPVPMLAGYVFAQMPHGRHAQDQECEGVVRVLGDPPWPVPDFIMLCVLATSLWPGKFTDREPVKKAKPKRVRKTRRSLAEQLAEAA